MLTNIYWILPEIFLACMSTFLLGYGVVLVKFGQKVQQLKKLHWLTIITLILTLILLSQQLNQDTITDSTILVGNGFLYVNEYSIIIKLILLSTLGIMLLISSRDLIMLYLAIELLSLSFYVLAAIKRDSQHSVEAGLKYFLLGALSSGLLLFGMALIYTFTGETNFDAINQYLWYNSSAENTELTIGATFIFIALLFKIAAAPFHQWVIDVLEGSPTIVTAYFSTVPKIAIFGTIIILINIPFISIYQDLQILFIACAVLSLIIGSVGALNQAKVKRLLAYSGITHIGFLLIALLPNTIFSLHAALIYFFLYIIMTFNTFAFVLSVFRNGNFITQLSGLSRYNPILAFTFAFTLLSIAGIPPLAGFLSKYLVLLQAVNSGMYAIAFIAVISSCIATFYYLRIIKWMFFKDTNYFHMKDIGDCIYPVNSNQVTFIQSIILGSTSWIILTFLFFPTWFTTFSLNCILSSLL